MDFALLFWRVVKHFGTDPQRLLDLPVYLFWSMSASVDRLRAGELLEDLDVAIVAQADEKGKTEYREMLRERLGTLSRAEAPKSRPDEILGAIMELPEG